MATRLTLEERRLYHKRSWEDVRYDVRQFVVELPAKLTATLVGAWVLHCIHLGG